MKGQEMESRRENAKAKVALNNTVWRDQASRAKAVSSI